MTHPLSVERLRLALRDLIRLSAERARAESETAAGFASRNEAADADHKQAHQRITERFASDQEAADKEYQEAQQRISAGFQQEHAAAEREYKDLQRRTAKQYAADREQTKTAFQEARWAIVTVYEAGKKKAKVQHQKAQRKITRRGKELTAIHEAARRLLTGWGQQPADQEVGIAASAAATQGDGLARLERCIEEADERRAQLRRLTVPRYAKLSWLIPAVILVWLVASAPAFLFNEWYLWLAASTAGALALGAGLGVWLRARARTQVSELYRPLCQAVADAEAAAKRARDTAGMRCREQLAENKQRRDHDGSRAEQKFRPQLERLRERRDAATKEADDKYQPLLAGLQQRHDTDLAEAEAKHDRLLAEARQRQESESRQADEEHARRLADSKARHDAEWDALATRWRDGLRQVYETVAQANEHSRRLFPEWDDSGWRWWEPPTAVPPAVRFGRFVVRLEQIPGGVPLDPRLIKLFEELLASLPALPSLSLPALVDFPEHASLLVKVSGAARPLGVQVLQAAMLRFLTGLPPGKVRFTIIDPVGLGENFAAFMHLADYDEQLVASRIWTEPPHIEQRLADLTEHMETVIQKYLRNQYRSITEYNEQAGEVAEPFRVLVVANFPVNFSAEAARRLVSIANSGAGCGVSTLITVDTKQPFPEGFSLKDLEQACATLIWKPHETEAADRIPLPFYDGHFFWKDPDFGPYLLFVDPPPDDAFSTRLLHVIGAKAKDASRVEVPFDFLCPASEQWWTSDSRAGIRVSLGRVGATKRQYLELGKGTSQHVLIAGKTGSGKSTLLHVLITNLALHYSPDEVELYLVDFKKGVEFKTYAVHELPHARVVAVESEREFGLSVLQRLDAELRQRGELFRAAGVQDINGYRGQTTKGKGVEAQAADAGEDGPSTQYSVLSTQYSVLRTQHDSLAPGPRSPAPAMPRILLIVDEFQEFFVEDDKIAQEAALLLDRLVRQGRAFGLHVVLGSQTLGGAYSLARSTIDQMAVRIALQCSEADACLILSKDNAAARLLSRPGEAIYNDANGLVEGNDFFQVVWLPDDRREQLLHALHERDRQDPHRPPRPRIVFEGNVPSDVGQNQLLNRLLLAPRSVEAKGHGAARACQAWLGEAMAIKDPTAAVFRPQSGCNLLMIGQDAEATLAIAAVSLVSLAAQHPVEADSGALPTARFYVLDGTPADDPHAGYLSQLTDVLPHPAQVVSWRDLSRVLTEVAEEVERRQQQHELEGPAVYLFIHGLQRFRDLRRGEDDFGFSRSDDQPATPDKQLAMILKEGPRLGVYTMLWCDSLNNVNRCFDRPTLRELGMLVLFQMSAADSSTLIDTPLASKLGLNRALFHSEDRGQAEKFRPYGLPPAAWLAWVKEQLHGRPAVAAG